MGAAAACAGRAGPGGAGRAEEGSCRSSGRRPPACPGLASGRSLRLLPAPSPSPPVLPSPLVHDGNTMAAAAQLSLTQVTPPAHPLGSVGRCPRSTPSSPHPPRTRRQGFTDPGIFSRRRAGRRIVRACACVREGRRHPEPAAPRRQPRPRPGRWAPPAPPLPLAAALRGSPPLRTPAERTLTLAALRWCPAPLPPLSSHPPRKFPPSRPDGPR